MKYFLHDSSSYDDEKISELFIEYGYEGLGLFYTILEKLAKQEKPVSTKVLKHQLKIGKKLEKCWLFMESLGLISSYNGETFNTQLLKFSEKYKIKSEKNAKRISEWRENQALTENVTRSESVRNSPKGKVKESKVNRSKEKVNELSNSFPVSAKSVTVFNFSKICFSEFYKTTFGHEYYFQAKDAKKIKDLLLKIEFKIRESKKIGQTDEHVSEVELQTGFEFFIVNGFKNSDNWLQSNFNLSNLDGKFNDVFTAIKQNHAKKSTNSNNSDGLTAGQRAANLYANG